jgi:DNA repair photolyase
MDHDFEDIEVKRDAPRILEEQLRRKKKRCMIGTGAMCDPYLHLEDELEITRECLKVIDRYGFGLSILTKSGRILRDIDLLKSINEKARCVVQITLTTYDDDLCRKIEPDVSLTSERSRILETMADAGIPTVVWLCPTLPFINDTEENLRGILGICARTEVKGILCFGFGVTMREGNREYFYGKLDEHFPGVKDRYIRTFGDSYECRSPNSARLMGIFRTECERHGILHRTGDVLGYMKELTPGSRQTTLF